MATLATPLIRGIDISSYEPQVNWQQVKASGNKFAIIKCSEGKTIHDSTFKAHWAGAKAAGVIRGPYHFLHFTSPADQQFENVKSMVGPVFEKGDLGLAVDVEWADGLSTVGSAGATIALKMLKDAKNFFGVNSIVYTNPNFFLNIPHDLLPEFAQYILWDASFVATNPKIPPPWRGKQFWQYSDHVAIPGIGKIDADYFYGTIDDLKALTKQ